MERCGRTAKSTGGKPCRKPAGWGTDTPGSGPCRIHRGRPIKHGRYSKIQRPRIQQLMNELAQDPDPFNLEPEARLIRALALDFCERYDELVEALLEWNAHEFEDGRVDQRKPRPQRIPDYHDVAQLAEMVSRVIERAQKVKDKSALSLETLSRVMEAMGATVARHVKDPDTLRAIEREWGEIRVSG